MGGLSGSSTVGPLVPTPACARGAQEGELEAAFEKSPFTAAMGFATVFRGGLRERGMRRNFGNPGEFGQAVAPSPPLAWRQSHFCPG